MFKTFPEFSKLTLAHRTDYESLIKHYPPIADLSFGSLMTWWNSLNSLAVSQLNGNLVIPYWLPGDEAHSGLSLIGTKNVDESFCVLFDYFRERGDPIRLVNVPYFVIDHVRYPELFNFKEDRAMFDYVLDTSKFYPIQNLSTHRRKKVEQQLALLKDLEVKSVDLETEDGQRLLLDAADGCWDINLNNFGKVEKEAFITSVLNARDLGMHNICLFAQGKLQGFCIFQRPQDKTYIIVNHVKATKQSLVRYELLAYLFCKWLQEQGVQHANINSDLGLMRLRMFTLTFGPVNFFRKYRVEPA